ncbi:ECF-type sigma factor [Myxococcota bacterium]|nr:ECF-type sigma factor [Myxococcota bacterium]
MIARDTDEQRLDALWPRVWEELRRVARAQLSRERAGHTLQPTALVHEVYLKLASDRGHAWKSEDDLVRIAARAMRQVLIDHARRRAASKRSASPVLEPADPGTTALELASLDQALEKLAAVAPRHAQLVELRVLAGYTVEEAAVWLGVSTKTVQRDWRLARAWLVHELSLGYVDPED